MKKLYVGILMVGFLSGCISLHSFTKPIKPEVVPPPSEPSIEPRSESPEPTPAGKAVTQALCNAGRISGKDCE